MMDISGISGLMTHCGKTRSYWQAALSRNLPVKVDPPPRSGKPRVFDSVEIFAWVIKDAEAASGGNHSLTGERTRLTAAQADKVEMEIAVLQGRLVEEEVIERTWARMTSNARQRLLALPNRLASQCNGQDFAVILSRSEELVYEVLGEIGDYDPADYQ